MPTASVSSFSTLQIFREASQRKRHTYLLTRTILLHSPEKQTAERSVEESGAGRPSGVGWTSVHTHRHPVAVSKRRRQVSATFWPKFRFPLYIELGHIVVPAFFQARGQENFTARPKTENCPSSTAHFSPFSCRFVA